MAELSSMARPDLALTKAAGFTRPAGPYPPPPATPTNAPPAAALATIGGCICPREKTGTVLEQKKPCLSLICCCLTLQPDPDSIWQRPDGEAGARVEGQYFGTQQERVAAAALTGAKL